MTKAAANPSLPSRGEGPAARSGAAPAADAGTTRFVDEYLAFLLAQASHRVSGVFHHAVEGAGLSVTEWRVLASLSGSAGETIGALSELTLTKQPTLSKIIQRMERQGLVERRAAALDRRQTLVAMTPAGRALAARCVQRALQHQSRVLRPLGARNARTLIRVLRQLIDLPEAR